MSEIDVGQNISNALTVIGETYENLSKLFNVMEVEATKIGLNRLNSHPLRWSSDSYAKGWFRRHFNHLFVREEISSGQNATLFVTEVSLDGCETRGLTKPTIFTAAFRFQEFSLDSIKKGLGDCWPYYHPIHGYDNFNLQQIAGSELYKSTPKDESHSNRYQTILGAVIAEQPLESVSNEDSVRQLIQNLKNLESVAMSSL